MRRHVIVSGILLILPVTDLALAAPVLVQENHQAWVDVVHIPKDTITVLGYLGKRGDEELGKLLEKVMEKPAKSSDAHALSSSAPLGPDHGSTDVVQAPGPNPASSTGNPDPLTEPPGLVSTAPMQGSWENRFIIIMMRLRMTYFLIKATMRWMGYHTPWRRQSMTRTMS